MRIVVTSLKFLLSVGVRPVSVTLGNLVHKYIMETTVQASGGLDFTLEAYIQLDIHFTLIVF